MHYYEENQDSEFKPELITINFNSLKINLYSAKGVFSKDRLDKGTLVLLKYLDLSNADKILDLGCGYGVVGIIIKMLFPEKKVYQSDINKRAVLLTKMNNKLLKLDNKIINSNLFENISDKDFDLIITNPPYAAGRELILRMVKESKEHLKKGGSLQLVFRYQKGGKYIEDYLKKVFGNVFTLGKKSGFRVFKSIKR